MNIPRPGVISVKVTFWVSLVVVTIVASHIYVTRPERRFFEQKMMESSRIAQIIESHLLAEMMGGEPDNIQRHMQMLPAVAGIHSVEIVNPDMKVRFSTDSTRVGLQVDRSSEESCQHCHSQSPIPNRAVYELPGAGRAWKRT